MESLVGKIDLKESLKQQLEKSVAASSGVLKDKRVAALAHFEELGFPTIKNEEWKYTNVSNAIKKEYQLNASLNLSNKELQEIIFPSLEGNILVVVNGEYQPQLSTIIEKESSLEIKKLSEASADDIQNYFSEKVSVNDAFTALNTAAADTLFLKVPKGKVVEAPIYCYFIHQANNENVFVQPRLLLVAEERAEVKLAELHIKAGSLTAFANSYTEVILQQDANVEYYKIQPNAEDFYQVGTTQVVHKAKSVFAATTISLGGNLVRNNMNIVLGAQHCDSTLYGLYLANANQHVDNHTLVDHALPNCLSNELYKGVLNGKSTGVFNGKIFVREDAQKTNAFQSNKNILLSKDASMNTKPQLEIFADDVKCSHGATIGQLDDGPLFYLRSRGLSEESAKALLVSAFAQDIVEHIKIEPLKELLKEMLAQHLSVQSL